MKKSLLPFIGMVMTLTLFSLASCDNPTDAAGTPLDISVGIVFPNKSIHWQNDSAALKTALTGYDVGCSVFLGDDTLATETAAVTALIDAKISVLIITPVTSSNSVASLEAAKDAGITVICYDRLPLSTEAIDYYSGFLQADVGIAQGRYLADNASGTGIPLYLYGGSYLDSSSVRFFRGAWSVLQPKIADGTFVIENSQAATNLKNSATLTDSEIYGILGTNAISGTPPVMTVNGITTHWNNQDAGTLAAKNLDDADASQKGNVFILGPNDGTARAILQAFEDDPDVSSYVITGQDAEKPSVQSIIDGDQSMTVFKDTRTLASNTARMAADILQERQPETQTYYDNGIKQVPQLVTDIVVVTAANVREALIDTGYYSASDFTGL